VSLPQVAHLVGLGDDVAQDPLEGYVGERLLAGHHLELVDDALVGRVGHGDEHAVSLHQHRQDAVSLGHFPRHQLEIVGPNHDLGQIDPRAATLLAERLERGVLVDHPVEGKPRDQREIAWPLVAQGVGQLLGRNRPMLEQNAPDGFLLLHHLRPCPGCGYP
jgi:hypothetical protein